MFKYTLDNKRYHTLNYYLRNKFNSKVCKISLNAGFTCPNIDGKVGYTAQRVVRENLVVILVRV